MEKGQGRHRNETRGRRKRARHPMCLAKIEPLLFGRKEPYVDVSILTHILCKEDPSVVKYIFLFIVFYPSNNYIYLYYTELRRGGIKRTGKPLGLLAGG